MEECVVKKLKVISMIIRKNEFYHRLIKKCDKIGRYIEF